MNYYQVRAILLSHLVYILDLPVEIICIIFNNLDLEHLIQTRQVCRLFNNVFCNEDFKKQHPLPLTWLECNHANIAYYRILTKGSTNIRDRQLASILDLSQHHQNVNIILNEDIYARHTLDIENTIRRTDLTYYFAQWCYNMWSCTNTLSIDNWQQCYPNFNDYWKHRICRSIVWALIDLDSIYVLSQGLDDYSSIRLSALTESLIKYIISNYQLNIINCIHRIDILAWIDRGLFINIIKYCRLVKNPVLSKYNIIKSLERYQEHYGRNKGALSLLNTLMEISKGNYLEVYIHAYLGSKRDKISPKVQSYLKEKAFEISRSSPLSTNDIIKYFKDYRRTWVEQNPLYIFEHLMELSQCTYVDLYIGIIDKGLLGEKNKKIYNITDEFMSQLKAKATMTFADPYDALNWVVNRECKSTSRRRIYAELISKSKKRRY